MPVTPKPLPEQAAPMVKPASQSKNKGLHNQRDVNRKAKERYEALQRQKKSS